MDRWDVLEFAGASMLGAGVWLRFGAPWALMVWGGLALALAAVRGVQLAALARARASGGE